MSLHHHHASDESANGFFRHFGAPEITPDDDREARRAHLTPRQREVLALLCEGLSNKLICRRLNITAGTVKVHIGVILRELGVTSRLQAVVAARRCGLLGEITAATPERMADSASASQSRSAAGAARSAFHSLAVAC
jgi:DNA-binding CsgD family transcriptional regulator